MEWHVTAWWGKARGRFWFLFPPLGIMADSGVRSEGFGPAWKCDRIDRGCSAQRLLLPEWFIVALVGDRTWPCAHRGSLAKALRAVAGPQSDVGGPAAAAGPPTPAFGRPGSKGRPTCSASSTLFPPWEPYHEPSSPSRSFPRSYARGPAGSCSAIDILGTSALQRGPTAVEALSASHAAHRQSW